MKDLSKELLKLAQSLRDDDYEVEAPTALDQLTEEEYAEETEAQEELARRSTFNHDAAKRFFELFEEEPEDMITEEAKEELMPTIAHWLSKDPKFMLEQGIVEVYGNRDLTEFFCSNPINEQAVASLETLDNLGLLDSGLYKEYLQELLEEVPAFADRLSALAN
jgi:hypothetical protein